MFSAEIPLRLVTLKEWNRRSTRLPDAKSNRVYLLQQRGVETICADTNVLQILRWVERTQPPELFQATLLEDTSTRRQEIEPTPFV